MIDLDYKPKSYNPDWQCLREGVYKVMVDEITMRRSAAGHEYLAFKYKVIDDNGKDALIFDNVNLYHPSEKVRAIAQSRLDGIAYALSVTLNLTVPGILKKPMQVKVIVKDNKNQIVKFYKITDVIKENTETKNPNIDLRSGKPASSSNSNVSMPTADAEPLPEDDDIPF